MHTLRTTEGTRRMQRPHSMFGVLRLTQRVLVTLISIILLIIIYHCYSCPSKISYKVGRVYSRGEDFRIKENQDFLIDTPGCYIPNYAKTYKYDYLEKPPKLKNMCGARYIFIDTIGDDKIKFRIKKYTQMKVSCCYRFARESVTPGHEHNLLSYTPCETFTNNTVMWLEHEVITVTCKKLHLHPTKSGKSKTDIIYQDTYIILKKMDESNSQSETNDKSMRWNVLMIGLDGMSRTRLFDTMPHTTKYLKKHKWLDFKAYQKVGDSTFQNLMSVLTGKIMPSNSSNCTPDLEKCTDLFIWKKYKHFGYKTAHGESNLLSETFCSGFKKSPTDHNMRPVLRTTMSSPEELLCLGKKPSATHLLEYALKFVNSYKANSFFGLFWINTYISYNDTSQLSDTSILNFFQNLKGVLNNTFVIFFSDQGISFGAKRHSVESYYDNQLPMLFVWTPLDFRRNYTRKHYNLRLNQDRLITPYDVYITLGDILKLSMNSNEEIQSEACSQCTSLFKMVSPNRTCADAGVGEAWCSCHNMLPVTTDDIRVENSTSAAVAHIKTIWKSIKTVPCTSCEKLRFPTIFRAHGYNEGEKLYHVIAFRLSPNRLEFEAVVVHYGGRLDVLTVRSLARYNDRGNCALRSKDRPYCVCAFNKSCIPENKSMMNILNLAEFKLFH